MNKEDAIDPCKWRKMIKDVRDQDGCEWGEFLLVPAYGGCPGPTAVKRLSLCTTVIHNIAVLIVFPISVQIIITVSVKYNLPSVL